MVILLLLLGAAYSPRYSFFIDRRPIEFAIVVALVLLIPPFRRWMTLALDRVRRTSWRSDNWTALGVALVATLLLYLFAVGQGRPFVPTYHDEHAYLIQMQMLARGRLWTPRHPMADFFETFHVFVKPVYAAVYFPGTALLYAPTVWLHLPYWFMPLLAAGAVVGMTYRVLTELLDGVAGLLGALLLLSLQSFRFVSIMMLSHPVMMLWGSLSIWMWLLWRRRQEFRRSLGMGIILGCAAITRPLDALCFTVPVGLGVLWDLRGKAIPHQFTTLGLMLAGMIPFLTIQFVDNYGITGNVLETPHHNYSARDYPGAVLGFMSFDPQWKPESSLLQKRAYYQFFIAPELTRHTLDSVPLNVYESRLPRALSVDLPDTILIVLLPVGLLGLTDSRRRLVWSILPIFLVAYSCFPVSLRHYDLPAALPLTLMLTLGVQAVAETWPRQRRAIETILTLVVASFAITAMPGVNPNVYDQGWSWPVMTTVHTRLPHSVRAPAVVLFPFRAGDNFHEEPVYNIDVAWPDDAPIIHVQDLGIERDQEIAVYYAKTQPDRNFYVFDRRNGSVYPLGKPEQFLAYLKGKLAGQAATRPATLLTAPP